MMERLKDCGREISRRAAETRLQRLAQRLRTILGDQSIEVADQRVRLRARGIIRRWLTDSNLRFLSGASQ